MTKEKLQALIEDLLNAKKEDHHYSPLYFPIRIEDIDQVIPVLSAIFYNAQAKSIVTSHDKYDGVKYTMATVWIDDYGTDPFIAKAPTVGGISILVR